MFDEVCGKLRRDLEDRVSRRVLKTTILELWWQTPPHSIYLFTTPRPLYVIEIIEKNIDIVNHHSTTVITRLDFHGNANPIALRTN
jgi:hypothetical protein